MQRVGVLLVVLTGISVSGCKVDKYLEIVNANEADATLTMQYEHGFEEYNLHWEQAQSDAMERCRAWGYSGAQFADSGTIQCIKSLEYGCVRWRVTYTCQCSE